MESIAARRPFRSEEQCSRPVGPETVRRWDCWGNEANCPPVRPKAERRHTGQMAESGDRGTHRSAGPSAPRSGRLSTAMVVAAERRLAEEPSAKGGHPPGNELGSAIPPSRRGPGESPKKQAPPKSRSRRSNWDGSQNASLGGDHPTKFAWGRYLRRVTQVKVGFRASPSRIAAFFPNDLPNPPFNRHFGGKCLESTIAPALGLDIFPLHPVDITAVTDDPAPSGGFDEAAV